MIFGKHINKFYLIYSWVLLIGVVSLIAVDAAQLQIPKVYSELIDGLIVNTEHPAITLTLERLRTLMFQMLIIAGVMVVGRFVWRICFFGTAIKVEKRLRSEMFDHAKDLSQQYYQVNKVGDLMALFTNDLETINECVGDGFLMLIDALALGSLAIYNMFTIHGLLALTALIPLIIMAVVGVLVGKTMSRKWKERQEAFSELSDFAQESYSGIAVIKAFVKETKEIMAFKKINVKNEDTNVSFVKTAVLMRVLITLFIQTVIITILGYGGYLALKGVFSVGTLIEFYSYFTAAIWPMMALSNLIDMTARGRASLKRVSNFLDAPIDVQDREDVVDVDHIEGNIEFRNLTFKYPDGENDVLHDVSFKINAGENVGIIGKTGCGKTTVVDLILRTYNVDDGTIFIDDKDINTIPIKTLRNNAAYVPQDNFLFSDTIENNIAFAFDEVDEEKVVKYAQLADIDGDIAGFDHGYKTVLGERGVTISGGQKQRTSIARALMKDANILILDDSVSAVDTKTEAILLNNLRETRKGKTTILIAHRISTIEKMDKILLMDDGKIIAIGTHEELLANCDQYKKMVDLQKLEDEVGGDN